MKTKTTRHLKKLQLISFLIGLTMVISNCSKKPDAVFTENTASTDNAKLGMLVNPESIQKTFDPYGPLPETKQIRLSSGKTLYYTDTKDGDKVVLSIPGSGGDALNCYYLFNHLRTFRKQLGLRIISVEKNGLGLTPYSSTWTPQEYAKDCEELLNRLGIRKVILFSQSAGGLLLPYVAERLGNARVLSIHLGNSAPDYDSQDPLNGPLCAMPVEQVLSIYAFWADPTTDFSILLGPRDLAVIHNIPGLFELLNPSFRNAVKSGSMGWLGDEMIIGCPGYHVVNTITAPVYIYHGSLDNILPVSIYPNKWKYVFPNASKVKMRLYENEEHISYVRNFEQVLLDMVGLYNKVILNKNGHNLVVDESAVNGLLQNGAVRGIVAWSRLDGK